ncbi:hypothetical protein LDL08_11100 [Nonomuraea glycinis]|uniref:DUF4260 family protein n=1 Tax=Nonomuraea glycinis TaxID=2047744 RepID=A0A918A2H4_9ACTN|nr:hypothetical protein [Nonomuraea glycinis]MCA2176731.1 hypothetical protein [Nonomuraea glycinis]GGP03424.1 hypothetical protein GCM10012278_14590 [Nonomuraea glycinis]
MTLELPYDESAQEPEDRSPWLRKIAWWVATVFVGGFAIAQGLTYGVTACLATLLFFALPDIARVIRLRKTTWVYAAVHAPWVPLVFVILTSLNPLFWAPLFTAALGWLTRTLLLKALRYGLPRLI